jgi:hypothetical protein
LLNKLNFSIYESVGLKNSIEFEMIEGSGEDEI